MSTPRNFNDDARAEMLCYLVVAELVAMARTGAWLRTDHTVESSRIWMRANGVTCDWQDRVALAGAAARLAPDILESFNLTTEQSLVPLFCDGWMLDYQSPAVCEIHQFCAGFLSRR
jgi:hypothetical protein